jgi:hypothetical protein
LQAGIDDQFFCEYCGSPLPGGRSGADWLTEATDASERQEAGAKLPDWLAELGETSAQAVDIPSGRADTHPSSLSAPSRKESGQGRNRGCVLALAVLIMVGCICLGGWMTFSVLGRQDVTPSLPSQKSKAIFVSAQEPWQDTGVRVRNRQVVSISYLGGTWGVWGGARGAEHQADAAGFAGEYRAVGLPMTSAPVGALLGRIGDGPVFLVARELRFRSGETGALKLMINDHALDDNIGYVQVEVQVSSAE